MAISVKLNNIENYLENSFNFTFSIEGLSSQVTKNDITYQYGISDSTASPASYSAITVPSAVECVIQNNGSISCLVKGFLTGFGTTNKNVGKYLHIIVNIQNNALSAYTQIIQTQQYTNNFTGTIWRCESPNISPTELVVDNLTQPIVLIKNRSLSTFTQPVFNQNPDHAFEPMSMITVLTPGYTVWLGDTENHDTFATRYWDSTQGTMTWANSQLVNSSYIYFRYTGTNIQASYNNSNWFTLDSLSEGNHYCLYSTYWFSIPPTAQGDIGIPCATLQSNSTQINISTETINSYNVYIRQNSYWYKVSDVYQRINGNWESNSNIYYRQNGQWLNLTNQNGGE